MPAIPVMEEKPAVTTTKPTRAELDVKHKEAFAIILPEDLKKQQDEFLESMFGDQKKVKTEKKADENKAPETPDGPVKVEEKPAEAKVDEAKPSTEKVAETPAVEDDPEPVRQVAPESITIDDPDLKVEAVAPVAEEEIPDNDLDDADKQQLAAAQWLAKNDPRFAGRKLDKELKGFWTKEETYAKKWEKQNRGKVFNPTDEEHADFYSDNAPPIEAADVQKASAGIMEERVAARVEEKSNKRIDEIENQRRVERAIPLIGRRTNEAVAEFYEQVAPGTVKGAVLTKEAAAELEKKDPLAAGVLKDEAFILQHQISALETMIHLGETSEEGIEAPDGRVFVPTMDINHAGRKLEAAIMALPPEKQMDQGRKFVPRVAYNKRFQQISDGPDNPKAKKEKLALLNQRYWTTQPEDVRDFLIKQSHNRAKKRLDAIPKTEKKEEPKGATIPTVEQQNGTPRAGATASATVSSASDNVDTSVLNKRKTDDNAEIIRRAMW